MKRLWLIVMVTSPSLVGGCTLFSPTEAAIQHYTAGKIALDRKDDEAALVELAKAVRADPNFSLAHAATGNIYRKRGDHRKAATAYEHACKINPYAFRAHYNLGVTYQALSDAAGNVESAGDYLRKAVQMYLRAVMLKPEDFDTNLNLSACYFQMGKYDRAEKYCKKALKIDPKNPFAHSNLSAIYDAQNLPNSNSGNSR